MTRLKTTAAALILASGVVFAQSQTGTQSTGQTPPPKTPPATPPAAQVPAPQTPAKPATPPPPFPADAKIGYVAMQNIISDSKIGKCGADEMKALTDKDQQLLQAKQKDINAQMAKMQSQQTLVSESVMTQMQRQLEQLQREGQALQQDVQAKEQEKNQDLVNAFQTKVMPILEALRVEKSLWLIMTVDQAPGVVVAANAALDLSPEVSKRLDAAYPDPCKKGN